MRRVALLLLGGVVLSLLPLTVAGCGITCGCASTPDPNWTPPALTADEAATTASKFSAGRTGTSSTSASGLQSSLTYVAPDHPAYLVAGPLVSALVDAETDMVLEWVLVDSIPNGNDVSVAKDKAQAAAATFLSDRTRDTTGLVPTTELRSGAATSAYLVSWTVQSSNQPGMSVLINPSSGVPFAFVDGRTGVTLAPPTIGAEQAGRLALATVPLPGQVVTSADFRFDLEHPYWDVSVELPNPTASAAPEHGAFVSVDAVSGVVTVGKSY